MKKIFVALSIVLIVGAIFLFFSGEKEQQESIGSDLQLGNTSYSGGNNTTEVVQGQGIGLQELAKHNSASDCWVVYKNKVYDITSFIPNHPGGEGPIARTCGTTNFESAFQRQHGTSKASLFMKVTTYKGEFTN